jgi:putative transposase
MPPYEECRKDRSMRNSRKHPRLRDKALYDVPNTIAHVIIGTHAKRSCLSDPQAAEPLVGIIRQVSREKGNRVHAYCVMPDHVHILVEASDECGIIDYVKVVKGRFARLFYMGPPRASLLQKSFFDHVLRKDEDVLAVARYIITNPVRAGISDQVGRYPYAGSLVYDIS